MLEQGEINRAALDYRNLTVDQRALLKQRILARAHAERRQAIRDAIVGLVPLLARIGLRVGSFVANWWKASRRRHIEAAAYAELHALDDIMLKDMGISRSEIGAVVRGNREAPRVTAQRAHAKTDPCTSPFSGPGRRAFTSAI